MTKIEHAALAAELWNLDQQKCPVLAAIHDELDGDVTRHDVPPGMHAGYHEFASGFSHLCLEAMEDSIRTHGLPFTARHYVRKGRVLGGFGGHFTTNLIHEANKISRTQYCPRCQKIMGKGDTVRGTYCTDCESDLG